MRVIDFILYLRSGNISITLLLVIASLYASNESIFTLYSIVIIFSTILFTSTIFSINQIYDAENDLKSVKIENPISSGKISKKSGIVISLFLGSLSFILPIFISIERFILVIIILFLGIFYSSPPLRFKDRPFWDIFIHTIWHTFLILFAAKSMNIDVMILLIFSTTIGFVGQIWNQVHDFNIDRKSFLRTVGLKKGRILYNIVCLTSSILFLYVYSIFHRISYLVAFLLFLYSLKLYKRGRYEVNVWWLFALFNILFIMGL